MFHKPAITPWLILVGMIMLTSSAYSGDREASHWSALRQQMVRAIEDDIAWHGDTLGRTELSPAVCQALSKVPRHCFVPEPYRSHAYDNIPLPIGLEQTISQPTIVAVMTELMAVGPADTVLEVGTGSGYQAAVLAELTAHVHSIEIIPELARSARSLLGNLGYQNISVYEGNGYAGLPDCAPFAAIIVTAAPPVLPAALLDQLKPGGRLVVPVGPEGGTQWLTVWHKNADGGVTKRAVIPVRFVPMVGGVAE